MRLKSLELNIELPRYLPITSLRSYILEKLNEIGFPLRWSIANIVCSEQFNQPREVRLEAVFIID